MKILAIGSSSTEGIGASSPAAAYPARLEAELARRFDGVDISVLNRGVAGEKASETISRLRGLVVKTRPDAVVWQVGTNDALADVDQAAFLAMLKAEIDWLTGQGVDLVLMDPQYFPKISGVDRYQRFVDHIAAAAQDGGVPVMRRFEVMRHWASLPQAGPEDMLAADRFHMNDRGYACVAEILAEAIWRRIRAGAAAD